MNIISYLWSEFSVLELLAYLLIYGVCLAFIVGGFVMAYRTIRDYLKE
jgi:uncharacterized protein YneF (UPF0154 family)